MGISPHSVFSYPFLNGQHPGDFRSGVLRYLECLAACVACFRTIYTSDHEFLTILIFFLGISLSRSERMQGGALAVPYLT